MPSGFMQAIAPNKPTYGQHGNSCIVTLCYVLEGEVNSLILIVLIIM
jgi:hypothetical protein